MLPLTILAAQKTSDLFTSGGALAQEITMLASCCSVNVPILEASQVTISSVSQDLGDRDAQLTYPRVCLYSAGLKNTKVEKFRSLSGSLAMAADVWASGNLIGDVDHWIHFYVEAVTNLLRNNVGDWGDGMFFSGIYEVQLQSPKVGGLGFVQMARIAFQLNVSRN